MEKRALRYEDFVRHLGDNGFVFETGETVLTLNVSR